MALNSRVIKRLQGVEVLPHFLCWWILRPSQIILKIKMPNPAFWLYVFAKIVT
jgi:hypothetical protein